MDLARNLPDQGVEHLSGEAPYGLDPRLRVDSTGVPRSVKRWTANNLRQCVTAADSCRLTDGPERSGTALRGPDRVRLDLPSRPMSALITSRRAGS